MTDTKLKYRDHDKNYFDDIQGVENKPNNLNVGKNQKTQKISHWLYQKGLSTGTIKSYLTENKRTSYVEQYYTGKREKRTTAINTTKIIDVKQNRINTSLYIGQVEVIPIIPVTSKLNLMEYEIEVDGKQADNVLKVAPLTATNPRIETKNGPNNVHIYRNQADFNKKGKTPIVILKSDTKKLDVDRKQIGNIQKLPKSSVSIVREKRQNSFTLIRTQIDDVEKIIKANVTEIKGNNIDIEENETRTKNSNSPNDAQKLNTQYTSVETQNIRDANSNLNNVSQTIGKHLKFTDFLQNVIEVIKTFEDKELGNLANIFNEEIKRCNHDNCAFDELFSNFENRNYITHKMRNFENMPTTELREKLTEFQKQIKSENLESSSKYVIDYINSITYNNSQDKFMTVLHNFKTLSSDANRNDSDFENLIKEEMKTIFFDHYSSLDRSIQLGLGKLLSGYVRPIEQDQGRSFKRWHPETNNNNDDTEEDYFDNFDLVGIRQLLDHKIVKRQIFAQNGTALLHGPISTDLKIESENAMVDTKNNIVKNAGQKHKAFTEVTPVLTIVSPDANFQMATIRQKRRSKRKKRRKKGKRMRRKKRRTTKAYRNGLNALEIKKMKYR